MQISMKAMDDSKFQTPSARGGIPLMEKMSGGMVSGFVSNPFSAGRDSSDVRNRASQLKQFDVSNPFSAGRDSSEYVKRDLHARTGAFQTPSARGGIPLAGIAALLGPLVYCFKPLQRGAGFLWTRCMVSTRSTIIRFQTPSARGGIPLSAASMARGHRCCVSNPFSAGRDSSGIIGAISVGKCMVSNPFSAGRDSSVTAGVDRGASPRHVSNPFSAGRDSSAGAKGCARKLRCHVSNPFSAGRDSSGGAGEVQARSGRFQTPSARGGIPLNAIGCASMTG